MWETSRKHLNWFTTRVDGKHARASIIDGVNNGVPTAPDSSD